MEKRRNKFELRSDLIDAVGTVLMTHGFAKLGITLVADEARVDKTVIYRNYRTFERLLDEYIREQDYWLRELKEYGKTEIQDHRSYLKMLLIEQFRFLYSNKEIQQLLIWELGDQTEITRSIPLRREAMSQALLEQYNNYFEHTDIDFNSASALLISGIYFAVLHMNKSTFCNTDIRKRTDKIKFEKTVEWLVDLIFDAKEKQKEKEQTVLRCIQQGLDEEITARITDLDIKEVKLLMNKYNL